MVFFLTAQRIKNSEIPKKTTKVSRCLSQKNRSFLSPTTLVELSVSEFLLPTSFCVVFFPQRFGFWFYHFQCSSFQLLWLLSGSAKRGKMSVAFGTWNTWSRFIRVTLLHMGEWVGWAPFLTLELCAAEWCDFVTNLVSTVYTLVYHGISKNLRYPETSWVVANGHWGERSAICLWVLKFSPKSRVWDSFLKP